MYNILGTFVYIVIAVGVAVGVSLIVAMSIGIILWKRFDFNL